MSSARPIHVWAGVLVAGLAAGVAGCDPFTSVEFTPVTSEPAGVEVRFSAIRLTEGRAVGVTARPMEGDEPMDDDTKLVLTSKDEHVAGVEKSVSPKTFVVFGVAPGRTTFQVTVDDNVETEIPVEVLEAE